MIDKARGEVVELMLVRWWQVAFMGDTSNTRASEGIGLNE